MRLSLTVGPKRQESWRLPVFIGTFLFLFAGSALCEPRITAFHVSPGGDDANAGSAAAPFKTLERARDAMRLGQVKLTSVLNGVYFRTEPLLLNELDNDQTWLGNGGAVLDGQDQVTDLILIMGGSRINIDGFLLRNARYRGVGIHGGAAFSDDPIFNVNVGPASGNIVRNSEIFGISAPRGAPGDYSFWNSGGVVSQGLVPFTIISNNYVHDVNSMGMRIGAERPGDDYSGSKIERNIIVSSMRVISDGGAIYLQDVNAKSTDVSITHNYIYDFQGSANDQGRGIYLDQSASNVDVSGNIIRAGPHGAEGSAALMISGGSNNRVTNNVVDLGCSSKIITAIFLMLKSGPNTSMSGNTFERNLVLSNFRGLQKTTTFNHQGYSFYCGGKFPTPKIRNNVYFNAARGEQRTDGDCVSDDAPVSTDPGVVGKNYRLNPRSPVFNAPISFVSIDPGWGPNGSLPDEIPEICQLTSEKSQFGPANLLRRFMQR